MTRTTWVQFYMRQYLTLTGQRAYHAVVMPGQGLARRTDYRILVEEHEFIGMFYYWYFRPKVRLPKRG